MLRDLNSQRSPIVAQSVQELMLIGFPRTIGRVTIERISAGLLLPKRWRMWNKTLRVFYDNPWSCLYRNVIVL